MNSVHFSSQTDDWSTPQAIFDQLHREFAFTLDPCAAQNNAKCEHFYTKDDNGLLQPWFGRVFMNPPYGREIGKWVAKAYNEVHTRERERADLVVCLLPARTDTKWWHEYCMKGEIHFIKGRLKFGDGKNPAPFPSALVIFRRSHAW